MCVVATLPLPSLSSLHSARKLHFFIINRENPRYLHKTVGTGGAAGGHVPPPQSLLHIKRVYTKILKLKVQCIADYY